MSNEFDLRKSGRPAPEVADDAAAAPMPGKHANTDFHGTGVMGPMPNVPGKRTESEVIPYELVMKARKSSGQSLPSDLKEQLTQALGTSDIGSVTVHTGPDSQAAADALRARAYADGTQIHFAAGEYDPTSTAGQHLIAHEVAHTVQAARAGAINKLSISEPGDSAEHEASKFADAAILNKIAQPLSGSGVSAVMRKKKDENDPLPKQEPAKGKGDAAKADANGDGKADAKGGKTDAKGDKADAGDGKGKDGKDKGQAGAGGIGTAAKADVDGAAGADAKPKTGADAKGGKGGKGGAKTADSSAAGVKSSGDKSIAPVSADAGASTGPLYQDKPVAAADIVDVPSIAPVQAPQFDLPKVSKSVSDNWVKQTGRTPEQHHAQITAAIAQLTSEVQAAQTDFMTLSGSLQSKVTKDIADRVAGFTSTVTAPGRARVNAAYAGMDKVLETAAQKTLTDIDTQKKQGFVTIITTQTTQQAQLILKLQAAQGAVQTVVAKNAPIAAAEIKKFAAGIPKLVAANKEKAKNKANDEAQGHDPAKHGGTESREGGELALKADVYGTKIRAHGKGIGEVYDKTLTPIGTDIDKKAASMVEGAIAETSIELKAILQVYEKSSVTNVGNTGTSTNARLDAQEIASKKAVADAKVTSKKKVDAEKTAAIEGADKAGKELADNSTAAGTELTGRIKKRAAQDAAGYAAITANLQRSLRRGGPHKYEQIEPQISGAKAELQKLHDANKEGLGQMTTSGTTELVTTLGKQQEIYQAAIKDREDQAKKSELEITKDVAKGGADMAAMLGGVAATFTESVTKETAKIDGVVAKFNESADGALKEFAGKVNEKLQQIQAEADKAFAESYAGKFEEKIKGDADKEVEAKKKTLQKDAGELRNAMDGWGTDENKIYGIMRKCSYGEIEFLEGSYNDHFNWRAKDGKKPLRYDLGDEMTGDELKIAMAYLQHQRTYAIKLELVDSIGFFNDDEGRIDEVLRTCSDEEVQALNKDENAQQVFTYVRGHLSGCDLDTMNTLLDTKLTKTERASNADAIRLFDAMKGPGTDEAKMKQILEGAQTKEEREKLRANFNAYAAKQGWDQGNGKKDDNGNVNDALTIAIKDDTGGLFGGGNGEQAVFLELAKDERDEQMLKTAKMYQAADGAGTDEEQLFEALDDDEYAKEWAAAKTPEEKKTLEDARKKRLDANLKKLDANYDSIDGLIKGETEQQRLTWEELVKGVKSDGTKIDVAQEKLILRGPMGVSFLEYMVAQRKLQTGKCEPELMLAYACWGVDGTNEEMINKVLGDGAEPKPRSKLWGEGGIVPTFNAFWGVTLITDELTGMDLVNFKSPTGVLEEELSGKDWFKTRILAIGKPETPEQLNFVTQFRKHYATSGKIGGGFMSVAGALGASDAKDTLEHETARWDTEYKRDFTDKHNEKRSFEDLAKDKSTFASVENIQRLADYMEQDTEAYANTISALVDALVTVLELIGGVIISFATMGAGSPVLAAFLANMLLSAGTIILKAVVLGDQYGQGNLGEDVLKAIGTSGFAALGEAKALGNVTEKMGEKVASKFFVLAEKSLEEGGGEVVKQGSKFAIKLTEKGMARVEKVVAAGAKNVIIGTGQEIYNTLTNEKTYDMKLDDALWGENSLGRRILTNAPRAFAEGAVKMWIDDMAGTSNLDNRGRSMKSYENALYNALSDMGGNVAGFLVYVDNYSDAEHFWHELFKSTITKGITGAASGYAMHKARAKRLAADFLTDKIDAEGLHDMAKYLDPSEKQRLADFVMAYGDDAKKAALPDEFKAAATSKKPAAKPGDGPKPGDDRTSQEPPAVVHNEGAKKAKTGTGTEVDDLTPTVDEPKKPTAHDDEAKKIVADEKKPVATDDETKKLQLADDQKKAAALAEAEKKKLAVPEEKPKTVTPGDDEKVVKPKLSPDDEKALKAKQADDERVKKMIDDQLEEDSEGFKSVADEQAEKRRQIREKKDDQKAAREDEEEARDDRDQKKLDKRAKKDERRQTKKEAAEQQRLLDLATEAHAKYGGQIDDAKKLLSDIIGDLGEVSGRAKDPESAANRLQRAKAFSKKPINTVEDAVDNIWDALGTRVVLTSAKPEDVAKVMKAITDAVKAGKLEVTKAASNHGDGVAPFLTQTDLDAINAASGGKADTVNGVKTAAADKSAFTSGLIFVKYPNGVRGEIQIIGAQTLAVANIEHIPYDVSIGKPLARGLEGENLQAVKNVTAPIETAIKALDKDPAKKAEYDQYLRDLYKHARAVELGQESTPPKLPAGIDQHLSAEGLKATIDQIEQIKAKAKAEKAAAGVEGKAVAAGPKHANEEDASVKKTDVDDAKTRDNDKKQTEKPEAETAEAAKARRSQGVKPSSKDTNTEHWAEPENRKGVPEHVPLSRQELRDLITAKYGATMEKYLKSQGHDGNADEFKDLITRLKKEKPGTIDKEQAKAYLKEWDAITKKIEAKSGHSEKDLRTLYNLVEQEDFPKWYETLQHLPKEQQAKLGHMWREEWKIYVRDMMTDESSKEVLYLRDRAMSGDRRGARFDDLMAKNLAKNGGDTEKAQDAIIKSSMTSNKDVNKAAAGAENGIDEDIAKQIRATAVDPTKKKPGGGDPEGGASKETAEQLDPKNTVKTKGDDDATKVGPKTVVDGENTETKPVVRAPKNDVEKKDAAALESSTDLLAAKFGKNIDAKLTPPPADKPVLVQSPSDALIGLPTDAISPTLKADAALAQFKEKGIPRWPGLTEKERAHETKFANDAEKNLEARVQQFYERSAKADGLFEFEVDGAKKLYGAYGTQKDNSKEPFTQEQLEVRALANHALHPTAVAIARLAFLKRLDQMAAGEQVFVTNGGCGGGKSFLTGLAQQALPNSKFKAVWDAAGEGDAQENLWVLQAAQARGLKVTYGFVENDPMKNYENVLKRADSQGRIVDPITYARSYVRGQKNMKAFLDSEEYKAAQAKDPTSVEAIGLNFREKIKDKDNPNAGLLGNNGGKITAKDIPDAPDEKTVTEAAIKDFEKWLQAKKDAGDPNAAMWLEGGAANAMKFKQALQQAAKESESETAKSAGKTEAPGHEGPQQKTETPDKITDKPTRLTFATKGDALVEAAKTIPAESGYFDVVVHGDANSFYILHGGTWVPVKANTIRQIISKSPGYEGQPIRLISCEAGAHGNAIAQSIANGMGVHVKAPTETVWIHPDGRMTIGEKPTDNTGTWMVFGPGKPGSTKPVPVDEHEVAKTKTDEHQGTASKTQADDGAVSAGKKDNKRARPDDTEWVEKLKKHLSPAELEQFEKMRGQWKTPEEIETKFGGDLDAAKAEIARVRASKQSKAQNDLDAKEASAARADQIHKAAQASGLLQDPEMVEVVRLLEIDLAAAETEPTPELKTNKRNAAFAKAMEPIRNRAIGAIVAGEAAAPGRTVHREVRVMEELPEKTFAEWSANHGGKDPKGVRERDGKLYRDVTDIDLLVLEPSLTVAGKLRIVRREEIKTGTNDQPGDAKSQLVNGADALAKAAAGTIKIRLEVDNLDISDTIDLASVHGSEGETRGLDEKASGPQLPGQNKFDKSLGVRGDDLEQKLRALLQTELDTRADAQKKLAE